MPYDATTDCGRYWGASYDQYDRTWYRSIRPLPAEFGDLLEPGAGVRELLRFVGALAWLAARDCGVRLDPDREVVRRLQAAVELSDSWRGAGELRERLEQWVGLLP